MTDYAQALLFLEAFPEAAAWKVCVLTRDKKPLLSAPAMSSLQLRLQLRSWLQKDGVHFFVRPLISNLVFLDLDQFGPDPEKWELLVRLQPRAVVRSSPGNYQAWFTMHKITIFIKKNT